MSSMVTVATDDGYNVTSNDSTEAELRQDLGIEASGEAKSATVDAPERAVNDAPEAGEADSEGRERNPDGTFKAKPADEEPEAEEPAAKETKPEPAAEKPKDSKKGNPRHDPQARVAEATRNAATERRAREAAEQRLASLERDLAELRKPKPEPAEKRAEPQVTEPQELREEDFEDIGDYYVARAKQAAREEHAALRAQDAERSKAEKTQAAVARTFHSFSERMAKASEADASFGERITAEVSSLTPTYLLGSDAQVGALNIVADELIKSAEAPRLALYLSEHQEVLQRLASLRTPNEVVREMAKIEGRLDAATTAPAPRAEVKRANPPLRQVKGSPFTANAEPDDEASYDEHVRFMNGKRSAQR